MQILIASMHHSLVDMLALYPPRVYLLAWVPRALTQVAFFGLFARFVGGHRILQYALVGNGIYLLAATLISGVTASVTWERRAGTLPLLIASPTNPLLVFTGRNVGMAAHGFITGLVGIYVAAPLLGMQISPLHALVLVPLLLVVAGGSYGAGLFMGSLALHARGYQNVLANAMMLMMLVFAGVNYPVSALPGALQAVSQVMPLTHGLAAARLLRAGGPADRILGLAGLELLIGVSYAILAQLIIGRLIYLARAAGTLEYH